MWSSGAGKFSKRPSLHSRTNFPAGCAARARNSMDNNRNFLITIALSVLILTLWQVFYMNPRIEAQRETAQVEAQRTEGAQNEAGTPAAQDGAIPSPVSATAPGAPAADAVEQNREAALASAQRVKIDTPRVSG